MFLKLERLFQLTVEMRNIILPKIHDYVKPITVLIAETVRSEVIHLSISAHPYARNFKLPTNPLSQSAIPD